MNAVPAVNLWSGPATPFEVNGRELEYPIRPDALRYRSVECHSVEGVRLYGGDAKRGEELDRIAGFGHPRGTAAKWGMRRVESPAGAQVLVHFEGLDAGDLERTRRIAAPMRPHEQPRRGGARAGRRGADPDRGDRGLAGESLPAPPSPYLPALAGFRAMEALVAHLGASLASATDPSWLKGYLMHFPGASRAGWIEAIESVRIGSGAVVRQGCAVRAVMGVVHLDGERCRGVSRAVVGRVLREVLESRRGLNELSGVEVHVV